jgi:hypothetical protein
LVIDELAALGRAVNLDVAVFAHDVLDHDYRIGAFGHWRACHDLDRLARFEPHFSVIAGAQFSARAQCAGHIRCAYRKSISQGTAYRRIIAVSAQRFGKTAAVRPFNFHCFGSA